MPTDPPRSPQGSHDAPRAAHVTYSLQGQTRASAPMWTELERGALEDVRDALKEYRDSSDLYWNRFRIVEETIASRTIQEEPR